MFTTPEHFRSGSCVSNFVYSFLGKVKTMKSFSNQKVSRKFIEIWRVLPIQFWSWYKDHGTTAMSTKRLFRTAEENGHVLAARYGSVCPNPVSLNPECQAFANSSPAVFWVISLVLEDENGSGNQQKISRNTTCASYPISSSVSLERIELEKSSASSKAHQPCQG